MGCRRLRPSRYGHLHDTPSSAATVACRESRRVDRAFCRVYIRRSASYGDERHAALRVAFSRDMVLVLARDAQHSRLSMRPSATTGAGGS